MITQLKRGIPPRAAVAVVALVLLATIVSGREPTEAPPPAAGAGEPVVLARLDADRLKLATRLETADRTYAPRGEVLPAYSISETGEPALALPDEPRRTPGARRPAAPPLPFAYLGKMIDGDKTTVFVSRGPDHYSAEPGLTIDDTYKVEQVTETAVTFVYIPSRTRQVLPVPSLKD